MDLGFRKAYTESTENQCNLSVFYNQINIFYFNLEFYQLFK